MEAQWVAQRAMLRHLAIQHPQWTRPQLAQACGASVSFVKKWLKRFGETDPNDLHVLFSRSRARHTPPPPPDLRLVQRIIEIRTTPPENLQRTPGPRTILYYLKRDAHLAAQGIVAPRSTRTVWKILRTLGLILDPAERTHKPLEPCEPLQEVQMDFKDATTVPPDPQGKRQHVVEVLNFVDAGTSILLSAQPHDDFHAETALDAVIAFLRTYGLPPTLTFDHDPRWVGSSSGRDFPSALRRFLLCLGIEPNICPPCPNSLLYQIRSILIAGLRAFMGTPSRAASVPTAASRSMRSPTTSSKLLPDTTSCSWSMRQIRSSKSTRTRR